MNRTEFIRKVAKDIGAPISQSEKWVDAVLTSLADAMIIEDIIKLRGLGTFEHVARKPRVGRNASTGERIIIPAKTAMKFTPCVDIAREIKDIPVPEKD